MRCDIGVVGGFRPSRPSSVKLRALRVTDAEARRAHQAPLLDVTIVVTPDAWVTWTDEPIFVQLEIHGYRREQAEGWLLPDATTDSQKELYEE